VDTTLYLDVNRFMRATPWAHGVIRLYGVSLGIGLLALLVLVSALRARSDIGIEARRRVAAIVWTVGGAFLALGLAQPVGHLVARQRPYDVLHGVTVLVGHAQDFSFPSDHATLAGAIVAGLWLSRDRLIASIATVAALLLCFARVYIGAHYPGDVLAGLVFGAVVVLAGYPFANRLLLLPIIEAIGRSPMGVVVGSGHPMHPVGPGPAARPPTIGSSGSVRLLSDDAVRPVEPPHGEERRAVGGS
jgi:membrane-associated phospholipid phosphatase